MKILADTNVLLRGMQQGHPLCAQARNALKFFHRQGFDLCLTPQNVREFWNVSTRPIELNGFGLTVPATERHTSTLEKYFTVLPDSELTYRTWRALVSEYKVRGVKVHDAYIVASLKVHAIAKILTFDRDDFTRYGEIEVIHPETIG